MNSFKTLMEKTVDRKNILLKLYYVKYCIRQV